MAREQKGDPQQNRPSDREIKQRYSAIPRRGKSKCRQERRNHFRAECSECDSPWKPDQLKARRSAATETKFLREERHAIAASREATLPPRPTSLKRHKRQFLRRRTPSMNDCINALQFSLENGYLRSSPPLIDTTNVNGV